VAFPGTGVRSVPSRPRCGLCKYSVRRLQGRGEELANHLWPLPCESDSGGSLAWIYAKMISAFGRSVDRGEPWLSAVSRSPVAPTWPRSSSPSGPSEGQREAARADHDPQSLPLAQVGSVPLRRSVTITSECSQHSSLTSRRHPQEASWRDEHLLGQGYLRERGLHGAGGGFCHAGSPQWGKVVGPLLSGLVLLAISFWLQHPEQIARRTAKDFLEQYHAQVVKADDRDKTLGDAYPGISR
jgi:hypothetical protein